MNKQFDKNNMRLQKFIDKSIKNNNNINVNKNKLID
jgi:hypothetical protein